MISATFGSGVSSLWYFSDFIRTFGVVWYGGLTSVAVFCVHRDAKRLTDAGPNQISLE
jgi:hypothetical protein